MTMRYMNIQLTGYPLYPKRRCRGGWGILVLECALWSRRTAIASYCGGGIRRVCFLLFPMLSLRVLLIGFVFPYGLYSHYMYPEVELCVCAREVTVKTVASSLATASCYLKSRSALRNNTNSHPIIHRSLSFLIHSHLSTSSIHSCRHPSPCSG